MSEPSVWDRRAPSYDRAPRWIERLGIGDSREWACRQATGRTLEVAVGTGRNLALYPASVELAGIDFSPGMLAQARRAAADRGRRVDLREGDAERLPYADASFDTVVCTLALCAIADRAAALAEMRRVLRPDGLVLLVDHVERRWRRGRPADLAEAAGFRTADRVRLRFGLIERYAGRA
jgi:ubiquinone/menaquinone biosynthesis C-methylase UbiE